MTVVFSTTKGMAAMAIALAHSRGLLDYDARVATYWPEFAASGKAAVTIRQLLAHQAGLCCIDEPLSLEALSDPDRVAGALARQRPLWVPGERHGYHSSTIGFYEGELLRRVDPRHRSLGRFFSDEIARPLGLEFYIGLPKDVPDSRLAPIQFYSPTAMLLHVDEVPWRFLDAMRRKATLTARSFANPDLMAIFTDYRRPELRGLELPAVLGVGEARALARAYGVMATGGRELEFSPRTLAALAAPASEPRGGSYDLVLQTNTSFSLGYMKPSASFRFGTPAAFGTPGMGGSFGFADPERQVGYAYVPNRFGYFAFDDPRDRALRRALDLCLRRLNEAAAAGHGHGSLSGTAG
jgi:CubicO group peptidase (beta-lactamase class C family)